MDWSIYCFETGETNYFDFKEEALDFMRDRVEDPRYWADYFALFQRESID
jgi:hypothetical protein